METKKRSNKKSMCNSKILGTFFSIITMLVILCTGCGKKESSSTITDVHEESPVVESTEVGQSAEEEADIVEESTEEAPVEEQVEDSTANLSNEEWVKSLNVERPTFLVFNELTGERKALEDGAEYTLCEGDELGLAIPSRWLWQGENIGFYNSVEFKYNCSMYKLNYDMIDEKTEIIVTYNNRDGEPVTATVYLSK